MHQIKKIARASPEKIARASPGRFSSSKANMLGPQPGILQFFEASVFLCVCLCLSRPVDDEAKGELVAGMWISKY